ncbi:bacillithiol biosynthesis cysteine-adding enzyme BshC [bacterium (candidate division B38) B3_B38]|nr:MAG: bacillithiol biosynthesis cysteine-adding enzyme BshC [bacterium (candidate division B38) B3_B38]
MDYFITHNNLPRTPRLFADYIYDFPKVAHFYGGNCYLISSSWEALHESISSKGLTRKEVAQVLQAQNKKWGAEQKVFDNIALLEMKDTVAVLSGQQVGLLLNPLYTLYKALTAIKLAAELKERFKWRVVPIFWMEAEDHDLSEVNSLNFIDSQNRPVRLTLGEPFSEKRRPVGELNLGEQIELLLKRLHTLVPDNEFKPELWKKMVTFYHSEETFSSSFARLMTYLFRSHGLVIADPSDERLKALARPLFTRVIDNFAEFTDILADRNKELLKAGYPLQVDLLDLPQNACLFIKIEGEKYSLLKSNGGFSPRGREEAFNRKELLLLLEKSPGQFVPNVVLRPLFQDSLFPTIAYVAGPSEVAYFAQLQPLYPFFELPMPVIFPRGSFTVVENKVKRVMDRFSLSFSHLLAGKEQLLEKIIPPVEVNPQDDPFPSVHQKIGAIVNELRKHLQQTDPTLVGASEKSWQKISYQINHLAGRYRRARLQRHKMLLHQVDKVFNNLFPYKQLQERILNPFYYLSRYGEAFLRLIYKEIDLHRFDHKIIYLS